MKIRKWLIMFLFVLLAVFAFVALRFFEPYKDRGEYVIKTIRVADNRLDVYVADTERKREVGLAAFDSIAEDEGMIFLFDSSDIHTFWMKDMKFNIDIIWINGEDIVDITKNIPVQNAMSDNELVKYQPATAANRVLEVNSGWADRNNIKVGDKVKM
jgi:uncharacterized membrane protein (UPF0127 family)